ncbi:hypothetical protein M422DRAFT_274917 [Sphaerobolus stellatus SS14]|uniref:Uncharacterized protein n=1 Tax=Sphaerobolus stellatus (strain SS14) TaxID=990650 RepID=A0A0C9U5E0_SPHS4|nr:hypothetical protein M422DRAFT_274917 [Sphaerobolus stellatus SS14]
MNPNPHNASKPNFTAPKYAILLARIVSNTCTAAQAAELLSLTWVANNDIEKEHWDCRIQDKAESVAQELRDRAAAEELKETELKRELEEACIEDRKKYRHKHTPIPNRPPPCTPLVIPSPFVICTLTEGKHCPLWYFTNQGLQAVKAAAGTGDDDAIIPFMDPGSNAMNWMPAAAKKDPGAIHDKDLSFKDITVAVTNYMPLMQCHGWEADRIYKLSKFWQNLLTHDYRFSPNVVDTKTLIHYQAEQRFDWHEAIKAPGIQAWNISIIHEEVLKDVGEKVFMDYHMKLDSEACAEMAAQVHAATAVLTSRATAGQPSHGSFKRHRSPSPQFRAVLPRTDPSSVSRFERRKDF